MALALYRKYRSRKLADIVGQDHVTEVLARALEKDRVAHAYLFTGPRGTGKTSIARILAHEINELDYSGESSHLDIIEIDAASNNGVDDIRDLREKVQLAPVNARKKIYIIDEVHMLSKPAFNALLKTLEEPPEHVVFILATTDVDKLPETIISRTQRHTFRRATPENLIANLRAIAKKESIKIDEDALSLIAHHSDGSYRDSVSLLDQLANVAGKGEKITAKMIEDSLGLAPQDIIDSLVSSLEKRDFDAIIATLKDLDARGIQAKVVATQLVLHITERVSKTPELLDLVDGLLTVGQSSLPSAKLLAVLGSYSAPEKPAPRTVAATVAPAKEVVIPTLEKKATEPHPKDDLVKPEPTPKTTAPDEKLPTQAGKPRDINWQAVVTATKAKSIGLHSVLVKCTAVAHGDELTVYTKNEFYKKKLDTPKYRQDLQSVLSDVTKQDWDIITVPGAVPPKNSQVAAVAAMMGGGEEVSVDGTL